VKEKKEIYISVDLLIPSLTLPNLPILPLVVDLHHDVHGAKDDGHLRKVTLNLLDVLQSLDFQRLADDLLYGRIFHLILLISSGIISL